MSDPFGALPLEPQAAPPPTDLGLQQSPPPPAAIGTGESNSVLIGQDQLAQIDVEQGKIDEIVTWLVDEIERAKNQRSTFDAKLIKWQNQYEAIPNAAKKNWPWAGASNLVVPITASHVDAVLARMMNVIFGTDQLWVAKPRSAKWVEVANPIEDWLNWLANQMNMYKVCQDWFLGMVKFGTGILKNPWEKIIRRVVYRDANGALVEEDILKYDGPRPQAVPLFDFYVSQDAYTTKDIQLCEWIAHRTTMTKKQLMERQYSLIYKDVEKVLGYKRGAPTDMEDAGASQMGVQLGDLNDYEIWEVWCSYDLKGDGKLAELLVDVHLDTKTALRAVYNPYRHQERPFHLIRYMPRDNMLFGIGICQMLEDVQEEVSTIHNLRLDNATISNSKVYKRLRSSAIEEMEVYPGAFIDVDTMEDFMPVDMGVEHSTLLQEELHTNSLGERRTGVSDYTVGRESAAIGSRATATSTLALIKEGNKRFQMTENDTRKALADIAHQDIMMHQQFSPNNPIMYEIFSPTEQMWVQKFFALPPEYSRANVIIDAKALSETSNKDVDKQTYLALMEVMQKYYMGTFQAFQIALAPDAPPPMKQLAAQGASAAAKLWQRVLEAFDIRDPDTFVPNINDMLMLGAALEQMGGMSGAMGAGQGPGVGGLQPAMGGGQRGVGPANPAGGIGTGRQAAPGRGVQLPMGQAQRP